MIKYVHIQRVTGHRFITVNHRDTWFNRLRETELIRLVVPFNWFADNEIMTSSNGNFSALLAICAGNSPITGEFPAQRPVTLSFDVFFYLRPNERLSKQSWGWWYERPWRPLWRHSNGNICILAFIPFGIPFGIIGMVGLSFAFFEPLHNSVLPKSMMIHVEKFLPLSKTHITSRITLHDNS